MWEALPELDLSPRMAVRVAVPLDPPIRRVVCGTVVCAMVLAGGEYVVRESVWAGQ